MLCARANSLSGDIESLCPRPAGLSGWVTTPTTSILSELYRYSREFKAILGVPKKTTLIII